MITKVRKSTIVTIVALTAPWIKKQYDEKTIEQAKACYLERASMRGVERVFDVPLQRDWPSGCRGKLMVCQRMISPKRWIWFAVCRRTRQIVAWVIGDPSEMTCRKLWRRIPPAYRHCHTFSDFWEAYQKVFSGETHQAVGKESGQTSHVERWNNILRQRLARFVRRTLSFSKSDYFHNLVLKLFIYRYNQLRLVAISQN